MTEGKFSIYSQADAKRAYRFFCLRQHCYSLNTCGVYRIDSLQDLSKSCNLNHNTLRQVDLKYFQQQGWLSINGKYFTFKRLENPIAGWFKIFNAYYNEIMKLDNPVIGFCNRVKSRMLVNDGVYKQAIEESKNIKDIKTRRIYLKLVRGSNTPIGARQNIHLSVGSIGKQFGKSKVTGWRYLKAMEKDGLIRIKKNVREVCEYKDYKGARKALDLYGRTFTKLINGKWMVYERLQNTYFFL